MLIMVIACATLSTAGSFVNHIAVQILFFPLFVHDLISPLREVFADLRFDAVFLALLVDFVIYSLVTHFLLNWHGQRRRKHAAPTGYTRR